MSPDAAYLGIDLGTSGLKLTLVGADGSISAESEAAYDVSSPQPGFAETDPVDWAAALDAAAAGLSGKLTVPGLRTALRAIGVTGQMHGLVLTDGAGTPVRPAILWPDRRADGCLDTWRALDADVRGRLGNPIVAGMPGPLLSWLAEFEPESLQAASHVTFPKDWLRGLLTGDRVTERTDASATLLWDLVADDWSPAALRLSRVRREQLPALVASDGLVGSVADSHSDRFAQFGWAGVPVVAGGSDVACLLTALKQTQVAYTWHDTVVVNLGTGIQVLRPDAKPGFRPGALSHLYADTDGGWYEMVAIRNGGLALSWVQEALGLDWEDFVAAARSAPTGSAGATFTPFLTGERGLVASPDAKAGWSGLTPSVGRAELARSAFEALAFTVRLGVETLNSPATSIVLTGGVARHPWLRQLVADALQRPISYVPLRSASAVGAAVLAARGLETSMALAADVLEFEPSLEASPSAYPDWLSAIDR